MKRSFIAFALTSFVAAACVDLELRPSDMRPLFLGVMSATVTAGNAHDYAQLYAHGATITIHGGATLTGNEEIERYETDLMREFPGARLAILEVWERDDCAFVRYGVNGQTSDGRAMGHEGLLFHRSDEKSGLIVEERRYLDAFTPMAQLGALGSLSVRPPPEFDPDAEWRWHHSYGPFEDERRIERARRCLTALDAQDTERFITSLTDDFVVDDLTESAPRAGISDARAWFDAWTLVFADARTELTSTTVVGETVIFETIAHGTLNAPLGVLKPSSEPFRVHRAVIVELRERQIARLTLFWNRAELARAVGQWPPPTSR